MDRQNKVKTSYRFEPRVVAMLRVMKRRLRRSMSAQLAFLVEGAWETLVKMEPRLEKELEEEEERENRRVAKWTKKDQR